MIGMELSIGDWVYIRKHPNMGRAACVESIEAVNPDGTLLLTLTGPNLCTTAGIPSKRVVVSTKDIAPISPNHSVCTTLKLEAELVGYTNRKAGGK